MKTIHLFILSLFLLAGVKQSTAQTARKMGIEHKEIAPAKETEVKEAPKAEVQFHLKPFNMQKLCL